MLTITSLAGGLPVGETMPSSVTVNFEYLNLRDQRVEIKKISVAHDAFCLCSPNKGLAKHFLRQLTYLTRTELNYSFSS